MRIKPWYTLLFILLLAAATGWVNIPGQTLDPFGWKENIFVHRGLDLQGGLQIVLQARPPEGEEVTRDTLLGTRDTIERRVNALGVSEPLIQTRGGDQIIVELPGVQDPESAVRILRQTALLEIIDPQGEFLPVGTIVNTSAGPASDAGMGEAAEGAPAPTGPTYNTIVTGADLVDAYPTVNEIGTMVVGFQLTSEAGQRFYDYTSQNIGRPMSIVVDKQVINTATINDRIRDRGTISGMPRDEVNELALQLKSGALAVPLEVIQSRTVGPTLGEDSITQSIEAGLVGLSLVALFMVLFYRMPGILSVVALLIYTSIVFALFQLIPVVLTLAGIAGFILSIGMAVDANVLIFGRIKEELRRSLPMHKAIESGFEHAWPSIRDSNIATMITSMILYWFGRYVGASIIQGFALTLFIGVAVSMFSAITVSRTLLRVLMNNRLFNSDWWFGADNKPTSPSLRTSGGD